MLSCLALTLTRLVVTHIYSFSISAVDAGITILNEVGLDPGIDHLGALKTIGEVVQRGGKVCICSSSTGRKEKEKKKCT